MVRDQVSLLPCLLAADGKKTKRDEKPANEGKRKRRNVAGCHAPRDRAARPGKRADHEKTNANQ